MIHKDRIGPRYGYRYTNYKICLSMMRWFCEVSNTKVTSEAEFMELKKKRLKEELKKGVAYKKSVYI